MPGRRITPNTTELFSSSSNPSAIVTLPKLNRTGADFLRSGFAVKSYDSSLEFTRNRTEDGSLTSDRYFISGVSFTLSVKPETEDCPLPSLLSLLGSRMVEPWWLTLPDPRGEQLSLTGRPQERPALEQDPVGNRLVPSYKDCSTRAQLPIRQGPDQNCVFMHSSCPWLQFFLHLNTATLKIRFRVICSSSQCGHTNESFSASRHDLGL